jgi:tetratricopeptide (TPR) repeat protein
VSPPTARPPSSAAAQHLQSAFGLLNAGRVEEAIQLLSALVHAEPSLAPAHSLLGQARAGQGDLAGAEASLREAVRLSRRDPHAQAALGEVLAARNQPAEAEKALRAALAIDRRMAHAAMTLANLLEAQGRHGEALQVTTPLVIGSGADPGLLQRHGQTLRALGRYDEAIGFYERAVAAAPASGVAEHNLASAFGDAERSAESEAAARRAFAKGVDAPETWLVLARAQLAQGRYDEAEAAFREAVRRRPTYDEAQRELAHLIWMRTADTAAATAGLDAAIRDHRDDQALVVSRAKLLEAAGDKAAAFSALDEAAARPDAGPLLLSAAAQLAVAVDPVKAVARAEAALALAPDVLPILSVLCEARLAAGDPKASADLAERILARTPNDQHALAHLATAWRLLGDPRYHELCDYGTFVRPHVIDTPDGWSSLPAYLGDLREALEGLHGLKTHPVGQSLRHGSQTSQSLKRSDDPAIKGFFQAIDGPIRRHMAALGKGRDPVRRRNSQKYAISGIWSVRLKPGGFHVDHIHPQGWFSSACYIVVPQAVDGAGREGWIKFGEPGTPTVPPQGPEHYVKPQEGVLVLFPSYMWHGTVPFTSDERRMTVAFDVVPG